MLPLALTSTASSIRRLGGRRWRRLHRLVYVAAVLGVIHYWMSVKADVSEPLLYGACFAVLFLFRIVNWLRGSRAGSASLATGEV
jgi:sulfoxide reductase heme-binding subunit YedZ